MDYSGLKVLATADVVVCGGGTAGAFAAMAAADMMDVKDVLIIEQFGSLGGTATNGLVTPVMHTHIKSNPQCSYLSEKLRERLYAVGGCDASGAKFDPLLLKMILEEMCDVDSKCRFMYHTFIADAVVSDGKVDSIPELEGELLPFGCCKHPQPVLPVRTWAGELLHAPRRSIRRSHRRRCCRGLSPHA